jgi:hypothetical protein
MISKGRVRRKYPVQNITMIHLDFQLSAQRVSFVGPDRRRWPDMRDTGSSGVFTVAAPSRPRFARPRFARNCCVRSDLAAFTSAYAFSGRSEGTIRVSGNMRANNSEMLREVAIAGRPYLDAQLARRALISRQVASALTSPIGRPTRATSALRSLHFPGRGEGWRRAIERALPLGDR